MRERQQKQLRIEIIHGECEHIVIIFAVIGGDGKVFECVVHPTQIPFIVKLQPVVLSPSGDFRIGRAIFSDHHNAGMALMNPNVQPADEGHAAHIDAAIGIAHPVDGIAAQHPPADHLHGTNRPRS